MNYLNIFASFLIIAIGAAFLVAVLIIFIKEKNIKTSGIILAVIGLVCIGAPTIWNKVTLKFGEVEVVLEQIKQLQQVNKDLSSEVVKLQTDKKELTGTVAILTDDINGFKSKLSLVEIRNIDTKLKQIQIKNNVLDRSSQTLTAKISESNNKLMVLKNKVESINK